MQIENPSFESQGGVNEELLRKGKIQAALGAAATLSLSAVALKTGNEAFLIPASVTGFGVPLGLVNMFKSTM